MILNSYNLHTNCVIRFFSKKGLREEADQSLLETFFAFTIFEHEFTVCAIKPRVVAWLLYIWQLARPPHTDSPKSDFFSLDKKYGEYKFPLRDPFLKNVLRF